MKRVAVFCGASPGKEESFREAASQAGKFLAVNGYNLVYGGARIGLMGEIADAVLSEGGRVTGIIPVFMCDREVAHANLTELITVDSMHERKLKMYELSDCIVVLPGGFGTLDELFEVLTWGQLGLHKKPVGLLNINGYYDDLITMIEKMIYLGFLSEETLQLLLVSEDIEELLDKMRKYEAPLIPKLIKREHV